MTATHATQREFPLDRMPSEELLRINRAHQWSTYFKDRQGRVVGARKGRYCPLPHPKVLEADRHFTLNGKTVVEAGALEGVHTASLCLLGAKVTATDVRKENLAMVRARCALLGMTPKILRRDLEVQDPPRADVQYHVGVLYHLQDPVKHLIRLATVGKMLFLDTHYARAGRDSYRSSGDGRMYRTRRYQEMTSYTRAGTRPFSRWLFREDLLRVLKSLYGRVSVLRDSKQRNGPRITIAATR